MPKLQLSKARSEFVTSPQHRKLKAAKKHVTSRSSLLGCFATMTMQQPCGTPCDVVMREAGHCPQIMAITLSQIGKWRVGTSAIKSKRMA